MSPKEHPLEFRSFLLFLAFVSLLFFSILMPFLGAIFWAVALAIVFAPLQNYFVKHIKWKNFATLCTLVCCALIVVLPFLFIISSVIAECMKMYAALSSGSTNLTQYIEEIQKAYPFIQDILKELNFEPGLITQKISEYALKISGYIATQTVHIGQGTISFIVQVCIMLYIAFYMMRDSNSLIIKLHKALPLGHKREQLLFAKFSEVTRATIKGSLVVAIVQGTIGGLVFYFLGVSSALLWGVVMTLFSLIPIVGASIVWLPVCVYFFAVGETMNAIILLFFGAVVIGLMDNILRPVLVGRDTKLPDYVILLSTLGGFSIFGMNGFVVGPLAATLFLASWEIFTLEFNDDDYEEIENCENK